MKSLCNILKENKEFVLASGAYLVGSGIDYILTAKGIETGQVTAELGPIIKEHISKFGIHGILIPKLLLSTMTIIPLLKYADNKPILKNRIKFKAKYVLYPGAMLTAGAYGLSEMIHRCLF